jgi:23S rRNA pseudouridine2605 synthase
MFVTDGRLASALMRRGREIPSQYSVRVRGNFDESRIPDIMEAAAAEPETEGRMTAVEAAGGEGTNRWVQVACVGLRPRDLKRIFERCGFEANRVIRTQVGPIGMNRALARGRSRPMTEAELNQLWDLAGKELGPEGKPARRERP